MSDRQVKATVFVGVVALGALIVLIARSDNVAAGFSALFSFGLLVVAAGAAWTGLRSLRQLREDSRSRTRPMMAAELRPAPHSRGIQVLVIRNYGPSVARDVEVTFDPPLPYVRPEEEERSIVAALRDRYAKLLAAVVPGTEYDNIWFLAVSDGGDPEKFTNKVDLPASFRVVITYRGDDMAPGDEPYSDPFDLKVDVLLKRTYADSSSAPDNVRRNLAEHVARIARASDAIASKITGGTAEPPNRDILDP